MPVYLSVDGGGSKLAVVLFNEKLDLLGQAVAGGVNRNSTSEEDVRRNVCQCMDEIFGKSGCTEVDTAYITFLGDKEPLIEGIARYAQVRKTMIVGELRSGLLAGALWDDGFLAIAGTGSNLLLNPGPYKTPAMEGKLLKVGGWGAIMGDDGSGVWMGVQAAQKAAAAWEGWGRPTILFDRIMEFWNLKDPYDVKRLVYRQPSPYRKLGELTRVLGKAADEGDEVSQEIIRGAGRVMARQAMCLINRCSNIPPELHRLVCMGGAWKVHPLMLETFSALLRQSAPWLEVRGPKFEPVAAGCIIMLEEHGTTRQAAADMLRNKMPQLCIQW